MRGLIALALLGGACRAPNPVPPARHPDLVHRRFQLSQDDLHGASGLARGPDGHFWTFLERSRRAYRFRLSEGGVHVEPGLPVAGVAEGLDLEAAARIDAGTVALGTESQDPGRSTDLVLFARLEPTQWRILDRRIGVSYQAFGLSPEPNRGLEGLCSAGGHLVAASEVVGQANGRRYAPVTVLTPDGLNRIRYRVFLTTPTGKIAGLDCRVTRSPAAALEVFAIERHFEVARVLRFALPSPSVEPATPGTRPDRDTDVNPEVVWNLTSTFGDNVPNFEGLALDGESGRLVLMSDNDYGLRITGPTEVLWVGPGT